jgi:L-fuconolactonase
MLRPCNEVGVKEASELKAGARRASTQVQSSMKIDSHQHFWKYDAVRDFWITDEMSILKRDYLPDELGLELRRNEVDGSIAVQADQSEAETLFLLDLARQHDFILGVVGWVDFLSPRLAERLEYFSRFDQLRGFRHIAQAEPDDRFLARDDFVQGVAQLRGSRFTYDILIYPRQLPAAIDLVSHLPEQRFVLDHVAKPEIKAKRISPWAEQLRELSQNPNVYCKLSGLLTEADWHNRGRDDLKPYLDVASEAFGPERLMFGSDWPVCLLAASYGLWKMNIRDYLSERFSAAEREKIFGGNAARFYGLKRLSSLAAQNAK